MEIDFRLVLFLIFLAILAVSRIRRIQPKGKERWFRWYSQVYLKSWHWKQHRRLKFMVYGRKCRNCGETRGPIHLHHVNYRRLWRERVLGFIDTLPLCKRCHERL